MSVEFKAVEAIDALVALLRVADGSAVHCWQQDEPFHPGIFPGLILLARFAAERAGEELKQAVVAAEQIRKLEAERNAARELHLVTVRRYDKEVEQRLAMEKQLAQVTAERDAARQKQLEEHVEWASFYNGLQANLDTAKAERDKARAQLAELTEKLGELPDEEDEPFPEPYHWQVGDEVLNEASGILIVEESHFDLVRLSGRQQFQQQEDLQRVGWKLHRKASDIPPPSPQQVAEPISDNVGASGSDEAEEDDAEQEEEIVTLAEWAIVTSEPECSEWTPGRWDDESDGIGQVTMFRTGSTTERYVHNARIPVRDLRAAGINLGQWLRFREVLVCGESGRQEYRFEIRQCDQPISDSVGTDGEGQS